MTYIIITAVLVALGLYLAPSETKGALKWSKDGVSGIAKDAKSIHLKAKKQAIEDPESTKAAHNWLNETLIDTKVYHSEAEARLTESAKQYTTAAELFATNQQEEAK